MTSLRTVLHATLLALTLTGLTGGAWAGEGQEEARRLREAGTIQPLEEIVERAQRVHPGHVLEAELEREDNGYIYELELLDTSGVVWQLKYDAHSGELLKDQEHD